MFYFENVHSSLNKLSINWKFLFMYIHFNESIKNKFQLLTKNTIFIHAITTHFDCTRPYIIKCTKKFLGLTTNINSLLVLMYFQPNIIKNFVKFFFVDT